MDLATIAGRTLRKRGKLDDQEVSDEINACSIEIEVDVNGTETATAAHVQKRNP